MRNFLGIPFAPWIGQPSARPMTLCGADGNAVPIQVDWNLYGVGNAKPNFAVTILMTAAGQRTLLDNIKSVYIDNLGVNVPVYVWFPSTNFTVAAKANSANWYPVFSNDQNAVIVGLGFTNADINASTNVFFSNVFVPPYVDEEISQSVNLKRASTDISRGGNFSNSFYGAAALGDQSNQSSLNLASAAATPAFKPGPGTGGRQLSGFYYVTNAFIFISQATGGPGVNQVFLRDTDTNNTILASVFSYPVNNLIGYNADGFNEKLDATHLWEFVNPGGGPTTGSAFMLLRYSYQS